MTIHRRKFLQLAAATWGALAINKSPAFAAPGQIKALGIQLFTIPQMVAKDLRGTLETISKIGYRSVEFFGPYPFSAVETIESWKPIAAQLGISQNAFYGFSIPEVKKMLDDYGLKAPSAHLDIVTLRKNLDQAMENLKGLGVRYVAIPSLRFDDNKKLDYYKSLTEEFNQFGSRMARYDITFAYHNHGFEHAELEGQVPLDLLLKGTDSDKVKFELDIFWMKAAGADPVDYLKKYPGRFKLMHVKDASEPIRFSGDGGTPDQWMALFPKMADPGSGVFDIKTIVTDALRSGVDHFFLEHDLSKDPMKTLKDSYSFLSTI